MTDLLFPKDWHRIRVDEYVAAHREEFDQLDLKKMPQYALIQKISARGTLLAMLENDPKINEPKRTALNKAMFKEVRRQASLLISEYTQRVEMGTALVDTQAKTFLSKHVVYEGKPPAVTVGLKTLDLQAERG